MRILVPIDGSEASVGALEVGIEMALAFEADVDVVHISDRETSATEEIIEHAAGTLRDHGLDADPELLEFEDVEGVGSSTTIGEHLLELIEERGYDHVVMGTHGGGRVESMIVGSASETVLDGTEIPVTVVPAP